MQYCGNTAKVFLGPGKGWSKPTSIEAARMLEAELFRANGKVMVYLAPKLSVDRFGRDAGHDLIKE